MKEKSQFDNEINHYDEIFASTKGDAQFPNQLNHILIYLIFRLYFSEHY